MKAPKGMKWIDVTYTARRIGAGCSYDTSGVFEGAAERICTFIEIVREGAV